MSFPRFSSFPALSCLRAVASGSLRRGLIGNCKLKVAQMSYSTAHTPHAQDACTRARDVHIYARGRPPGHGRRGEGARGRHQNLVRQERSRLASPLNDEQCTMSQNPHTRFPLQQRGDDDSESECNAQAGAEDASTRLDSGGFAAEGEREHP